MKTNAAAQRVQLDFNKLSRPPNQAPEWISGIRARQRTSAGAKIGESGVRVEVVQRAHIERVRFAFIERRLDESGPVLSRTALGDFDVAMFCLRFDFQGSSPCRTDHFHDQRYARPRLGRDREEDPTDKRPVW